MSYLDLPYIYLIPKMHKNPYKHRFIAGSSKSSTKPLSILLTKLLTHIKQGLQKYCETAYSRSGINRMWILKYSKELLEYLKSPTFNHVTSIKSFDFSTLNTTIPHQKLKDRLISIIRNAFIFKNGSRIFCKGALRFKKQVLWRRHHLNAWVSSWQYFRGFCRKSLPADSRHSNGFELCPASRRHRSVFIRSGFHTVFAIIGKETFSISVQSHLQVHRWCIVHKQPRIRKLSGPDVSCWTWDQGHHREHNFCFLPRFTTVHWEGWSTSHFDLRQTRWFQFPHHKLSVPE